MGLVGLVQFDDHFKLKYGFKIIIVKFHLSILVIKVLVDQEPSKKASKERS